MCYNFFNGDDKLIDCIVYYSEMGHTKKYAEEIAEQLNLPVLPFNKAKKQLQKDTSVLFFTGIHSNVLLKLNRLYHYHLVGVVGVGISYGTEEQLHKISDENVLYCPFYYLRGGICRKGLSLWNRLRLKWIEQELSYKVLEHRATEEELSILDAILHQTDFYDETARDLLVSKLKQTDFDFSNTTH